jgi:hypothetical protein
MNITITINDAEKKALETQILNIQEWLDNWVHERARVEIDNIVAVEVQRKLDLGEPIVGTKEEIVLAADVETAADRKAAREAADAANAPE